MSLNTSKSISKVVYNNVEIPLNSSGITKKNITIDLTKLVTGHTNFPSDFFDNYFIDIQYTDRSGQYAEASLDESYLTTPQTIEVSNDFINIFTDCPNVRYTESVHEGTATTYSTVRYDPNSSDDAMPMYTASYALSNNNLYLLYNSKLITLTPAIISVNTYKYNITYVSIKDGNSYTLQVINSAANSHIYDAIRNSIVRIEANTGEIGTITGGNILSSTNTVAYVLITGDTLEIN